MITPGHSASIRPMHRETRWGLPPGRMVTSDEGDGDIQPLWLSDGPATAELWTRMYAEHPRSGLWPLLLDSLDSSDSEFRPWESGEVFPEQMSSPASHAPASLLARWWGTYGGLGRGVCGGGSPFRDPVGAVAPATDTEVRGRGTITKISRRMSARAEAARRGASARCDGWR